MLSTLIRFACVACLAGGYITNSRGQDLTRAIVSLSSERLLSVYSIETNPGSLVLEHQIETPGSPGSSCIDPKGKYLYVVMKGSGAIAAYLIGDDGKL